MLFHSLNTGEFVSDLKVSVHLNLVNWTGLKRYWLEFEGVLGACWLLPLFSLCAWGYPCAFPVLRGDKCKYQCDIFHSLCQAVNKALAWKLSLFNNKIFKSYTVLCIFQVKSSWILPVSIVLLWGTKTLSQKLLSFETFPPWQAELLFLKPDTGVEWRGNDIVLLLMFIFFSWHTKTLPFCIRTKEKVSTTKYWNEIFEVIPHPKVAIAEAQCTGALHPKPDFNSELQWLCWELENTGLIELLAWLEPHALKSWVWICQSWQPVFVGLRAGSRRHLSFSGHFCTSILWVFPRGKQFPSHLLATH